MRPDASRGFLTVSFGGRREAGCRRIVFESAQDAHEAAVRLAQDRILAAELQARCGSMGRQLVSWTAEKLHAGDLQLLWRRREDRSYAPVEKPAPPPAPVQRHRPAPAPSTPAPAYSTFPPDVDGAAIAQVLQEAAQDGVPFCEECTKAMAPEYSTFPPDLDAPAVAEALETAARDGIPFCEECAAAQSAGAT